MDKQIDRSYQTSQRDFLMPKNSSYKQNNRNQQSPKNQSRTSMDPAEYGDDEEEDDNNKFPFDEMRVSDAIMGICSVCHLSIKSDDATPADFDKVLLCLDGHLLCHRCIQQFAIQSATKCVLCAAPESQQSITSISRTSSVKSIKSIKQKKRIRTPGSRSRPGQQQRCGDAYSFSIAASRTNIASRYNIGMNYGTYYGDDNWNDTEHEDLIDEEMSHRKSAHENKQRSYCSIIQKEDTSRAMKAQINSQMISECSRRPIQCPRLDCAVNVAFSALTNHFIFDHPEVPILSVEPGEKSTLIVNFDGLAYDSSRCLALLLVSGKLSGPAAKQFNGSNVHPRYKNRLPLPIIAARLHCDASHEDNLHAAGECAQEDRGDVVIAWVAGLDIGNSTAGALRCSIQAIDSIDEEAFRSLTYTGPINSLRTAQKPREVFLTGDCVILHYGFINHITSGCENLNVNVTIH